MAFVKTNEFKGGLKFMQDGNPCSIMESEHIQPGKGQAFVRVKYRNLMTGRVLEKTFKSGESVEAADVQELDVQYLYNDGAFWHFMDATTFEQYQAEAATVADAAQYLVEQDTCIMTIWNGRSISVVPPNFIQSEVVDTDPGVRGDTASGGSKPATIATGAVIQVPLFINIGDILKVDTRSGEYVSRAK